MHVRFTGLLTAITLIVPLMAADAPQLPDGPGKATVVKLCNSCHGAQIVLGKPHSEDGWSAIVADMAQRGMEGTEDEMYDVVQYLTKYIRAGQAQPKVNVNKATVKEIMTGLAIAGKDAEAIVHAREKAEFKSIDDLKKAEGVDPAKIEARKALISFQ